VCSPCAVVVPISPAGSPSGSPSYSPPARGSMARGSMALNPKAGTQINHMSNTTRLASASRSWRHLRAVCDELQVRPRLATAADSKNSRASRNYFWASRMAVAANAACAHQQPLLLPQLLLLPACLPACFYLPACLPACWMHIRSLYDGRKHHVLQ
jgi:hypothetical protein